MSRENLLKAASAWDVEGETLEEVNARIHDGVPEAELIARADKYVNDAFSLFNYIQLAQANVMDIGSGMGFIMEALDRRLRPSFQNRRITGLDISATMLDKARQRLAPTPSFQEGVYDFAHYDGVTLPFKDNSFDLVFSVASLQHVPKPYVYNLFFELKRVLKDDGYAIIHLLPFRCLPDQEKHWPWRREIDQQLGLIESGHWHHFYTAEELEQVLTTGTGLTHVHAAHAGEWTCFSKSKLKLPRNFDPQIYLYNNADVRLARADPARHYLEFGYREGRQWQERLPQPHLSLASRAKSRLRRLLGGQ
jgi:ubiquinone/menaquinone biosynthesis C-methylase UbiE